jgi:hypothetical protein
MIFLASSFAPYAFHRLMSHLFGFVSIGTLCFSFPYPRSVPTSSLENASLGCLLLAEDFLLLPDAYAPVDLWILVV